MWLADVAWHKVTALTIAQCWRKASILPGLQSVQPPLIPIASLLSNDPTRKDDCVVSAERELNSVVDDLEQRGMLHKNNCLTIKELLNLDEESAHISVTDNEIFQSVMDLLAGSPEEANPELPEEELDPIPTYRKVLQATLTLQKYIDAQNNTIARELDHLLCQFHANVQLECMRSMVPTKITDYFTWRN